MAHVHWKGSSYHVGSLSVNADEFGLVTVTEVRRCRDEYMARDQLRVTENDCPINILYPWVKSAAATRGEAGMWDVTLIFTGVLSEQDIGSFKLYHCSTVATKEPIQTHPQFKSFGGTEGSAVAKANGAVFGKEGFENFKPYLDAAKGETPKKNPKAGVKDYYVPIVKLTETKLARGSSLQGMLDQLTTIQTPPYNRLAPPKIGKRTWLVTKVEPTYVARGIYKVKREWALSGPNGWDTDIY